jgi:hypothetical protein
MLWHGGLGVSGDKALQSFQLFSKGGEQRSGLVGWI